MAAVLRNLRVLTVKCPASKHMLNVGQIACISSKAWRDMNGITRPPPYDYKNKKYTFIQSLFDKTRSRIDENSKIICIEGPIAAGKDKFGRELAKELDMHYIEHANLDQVYINGYGIDLRSFNDELPPGARYVDLGDFISKPRDRLTAVFQNYMYQVKFENYIDALAHLFSTGQGVVMNRSVYSDIVFLNTLGREGWISKKAHRVLEEIRANSLRELMRPHLLIYLDVPVDVTHKRILERNKLGEATSELFKNTNFLKAMDKIYKEEFLQDLAVHSELLIYDWTNGGEIELVVEDIEKIDFENYDRYGKKMEDWLNMPQEEQWLECRRAYTIERFETTCSLNVPNYDAEELLLHPEDSIERNRLFEEVPGLKFAYGYNPEVGDKITFSTKTKRPERKTYLDN